FTELAGDRAHTSLHEQTPDPAAGRTGADAAGCARGGPGGDGAIGLRRFRIAAAQRARPAHAHPRAKGAGLLGLVVSYGFPHPRGEAVKFDNYAQFYPYYLTQHTNPVCRTLHFIG